MTASDPDTARRSTAAELLHPAALPEPDDPRWIWPGMLTAAGGQVALAAARCPAGHWSFPAGPRCPNCLEPARPTAVTGAGLVHAVTWVRIDGPWHPGPYGLAWIDYPDLPLRVFGRVEQGTRIGDRVRAAAARFPAQDGVGEFGPLYLRDQTRDRADGRPGESGAGQ